MKFWKLHGAGNDFVAIKEIDDEFFDYSKFASNVCHRHFGIGADGLLVAQKSQIADIKMMYYNSDGSIAKMCGNGLRCFVRYVYDNRYLSKNSFTVETLAGIFSVEIELDGLNQIRYIKVKMGEPIFKPELIPVNTEKAEFIKEDIKILDKTFNVSTILVGVPHTVIFVDEINKETVLQYGPQIEKHEYFPQKSNVNFVEIIDASHIKVYTWERGCGYTLACGTGICASAFISNYLGKSSNKVMVESEGGIIHIEIDNKCIYMKGEAVKICEGILEDILWQ